MKIRCNLVLRFENADAAHAVADALSLDNKGYVSQTVRNREIHARLMTKSIGELRCTLNDYLACASVAEYNARKCLESLRKS